jgi:hypothetical protein
VYALVKTEPGINRKHAHCQQEGARDGHRQTRRQVASLPEDRQNHRGDNQPQINENLKQRAPVKVVIEYLDHAPDLW